MDKLQEAMSEKLDTSSEIEKAQYIEAKQELEKLKIRVQYQRSFTFGTIYFFNVLYLLYFCNFILYKALALDITKDPEGAPSVLYYFLPWLIALLFQRFSKKIRCGINQRGIYVLSASFLILPYFVITKLILH
jgi:hypothetical protein